MSFIATTAQVELGDAFGFSPASVEWVAEASMSGPVGVINESLITEHLIREIARSEARMAAQEATEALMPAGVEMTTEWLVESSPVVQKAYDEQYAKTAAEVEEKARELGLVLPLKG